MKNNMIKPVIQTALAAPSPPPWPPAAPSARTSRPAGVETAGLPPRAAARSRTAARLPADWWTVFGDQTLNSLEQRAMHDNPNVRAAAQRLVQAQAQLGVVRAGQLPTVNVQAGVSNSRTSAETSQGLALGHRSIEGNNYTAGARLLVGARPVGPRAPHRRSGRRPGPGGPGRPRRRAAAAVEPGGDHLLAAARPGRRAGDPAQRAGHPPRIPGTDRGALQRRPVERTGRLAHPHRARQRRGRPARSPAPAQHAGTRAGRAGGRLAERAAGRGRPGRRMPQPPAFPVGLPASLLGQRPDLASSVANLRPSTPRSAWRRALSIRRCP
jgi:multidrug efflux system outer membrane protein